MEVKGRMKTWGVGLGLMAMVLVAFSALGQEASALIAQADTAFDRWTGTFEFAAYETSLEEAIPLWEAALALLDEGDDLTRSHVLNRLAQAYFELGEAYLFDPAEREAAYAAGRDHALMSLRLDPRFDEIEAQDGFRAALRSATDVAAIFWYGNALGKWLDYNQLIAVFGGVLDVLASYERAIELDETYFGGAPQRSLAALIAQAHFVIGKSPADSVPHYERAMEIDPAYLESYVNYAEHYAGPMKERALYDDLLQTLDDLSSDSEIVAAWPFYNYLAIRRARTLSTE